jgi:phosphonate transport system substrate-binding protein
MLCLVAALLAAVSSFSSGVASPAAPTGLRYTVAVIPFYSPEKIWTLYAPFINYLNKSTGLAWELKLYQNHDVLIDDLCADRISIALVGPVPLSRAHDRCARRPAVVALGSDGEPFYRSILLSGDPEVSNLTDLRGKKVAFFKGSTAAHILPAKMLRDAGLRAGSFQAVFYESQDRIMTALLTNEVSAAGVKETLYRKFKNEPLRVLQVSELLPNFSFTVSASLPRPVREQFIESLLKLKPGQDAGDAAIVTDWDDEIRNGFILPGKDYLPSVLRLLTITREILHEDR